MWHLHTHKHTQASFTVTTLLSELMGKNKIIRGVFEAPLQRALHFLLVFKTHFFLLCFISPSQCLRPFAVIARLQTVRPPCAFKNNNNINPFVKYIRPVLVGGAKRTRVVAVSISSRRSNVQCECCKYKA